MLTISHNLLLNLILNYCKKYSNYSKVKCESLHVLWITILRINYLHFLATGFHGSFSKRIINCEACCNVYRVCYPEVSYNTHYDKIIMQKVYVKYTLLMNTFNLGTFLHFIVLHKKYREHKINTKNTEVKYLDTNHFKEITKKSIKLSFIFFIFQI